MINMTSKMISIRDDVYKNLKNLKQPDESFSELLERLILNQKKNPLKHFGNAKNLSEDILNEFENAIIEGKKSEALQSSSKFTELWEE